jgi:hypothetical protein
VKPDELELLLPDLETELSLRLLEPDEYLFPELPL